MKKNVEFLKEIAKLDLNKYNLSTQLFEEFQKYYGKIIYNYILKYTSILDKIPNIFYYFENINIADTYYKICVKLILNIKNFNRINHNNFCSYIDKSVKNEFINIINKIFKKKNIKAISQLKNQMYLDKVCSDTESIYENKQIIEDINEIINKLPIKQKQIIILKYYKHLDVESIAQILSISRTAVYKRLNTAKRNIKKMLQEKSKLFSFFL